MAIPMGAERPAIGKVLEEIRAVACGENQLEDTEDDSETLAWIYRRAEAVIQKAEER